MSDRDAVLKAIGNAIEEVNAYRDGSPLATSEETRLFGSEGGLDSLGLVNLITEVEQKLSEDLELDVVLADARAMSRRHSPFATVGALADYVLELAAESESA